MKPVKFHTVEQPDSDITTFVLSCNRLEVLHTTLKSYYNHADLASRCVIVDDSGVDGVFEQLVAKYGKFSDVICFPENRSQWWAMDFMVSYCSTPYIFYLEDDWKFIRSGFLQTSKNILEKHPDVGTIDISFRTFEFQGIDSYERYLVDDQFYYKKPWRITPNHVAWYGWMGSPNLRRRDDLIALGRVEKWHNEWNIDRRFRALGYKAVFLKDKYVDHLGDRCSVMEGKRPDDTKVPEDYIHPAILPNRTYPIYDYRAMDKEINREYIANYVQPEQITIQTALVDINREEVDKRNFEEHYLQGLWRLIDTQYVLSIHTDPKYFDIIRARRGDKPLILNEYTIHDVRRYPWYDKVQEIVSKPEWYSQSEWMKNSIIRSADYISLTLAKLSLMNATTSHMYWVDSGLFNSYSIQGSLNDFEINYTNTKDIFMMKFPYQNYNEIHGFSVEGYRQICNNTPDYVCRACFFGGPSEKIKTFSRIFYYYLAEALNKGYIGTEEAILNLIAMKHPDLVNPFFIETGDVSRCLNYMRKV
jgi:hypothetical protein